MLKLLEAMCTYDQLDCSVAVKSAPEKIKFSPMALSLTSACTFNGSACFIFAATFVFGYISRFARLSLFLVPIISRLFAELLNL